MSKGVAEIQNNLLNVRGFPHMHSVVYFQYKLFLILIFFKDVKFLALCKVFCISEVVQFGQKRWETVLVCCQVFQLFVRSLVKNIVVVLLETWSFRMLLSYARHRLANRFCNTVLQGDSKR